MYGRYYITEPDLTRLLLMNTCGSEEAANTAYTEEIENMDRDDEVPPLVDVAYDESEASGNPLLAASLEVWNTGGHHSGFLTRELPRHRIVEAQTAIIWDFDSLQLNTEHIPHEEIQETAAPTEETSLTTTHSRPIRNMPVSSVNFDISGFLICSSAGASSHLCSVCRVSE